MLPIILSAPHGGRQPIPEAPVRRGVGVAQFTTGRDNNTGELVERIAAKLEERFGAKPFLIIALFERKYVDANRPSASAYESDQGKLYYESYHGTADCCSIFMGRGRESTLSTAVRATVKPSCP